MWVARADRKLLLGALRLENPPPAPLSEVSEFPGGLRQSDGMLALWRDDPRLKPTLPAAIILDPQRQPEFFAWTWSFLRDLRPLTAFVRVADWDAAEFALRRQDPPSLHGLDAACLGLVICEAASYMQDEAGVAAMTPAAFANTFSFAMARATALGFSKTDLLSRNWSAARERSGQLDLSLSTSELDDIWTVLILLDSATARQRAGSPKHLAPILKACEEVRNADDISSETWAQLTTDFLELRPLKERMGGPREERVATFESAMLSLGKASPDKARVASFLCGFLASRIGSGGLEYVGLVKPYSNRHRGALLWYGLCAGIRRGSEVRVFRAGLGLRIIRDILQNEAFLDPPRCDIAINELQVVRGTEGRTPDFLIGSTGHLSIEVAPCITTVVKWPPRSQDQPEWWGHEAGDLANARELVRKLDRVIGEAGDLCRRLRSVLKSDLGQEGKSTTNRRKG